MAVDYVYALHEFVPQNDDEIDFEAGERIEVIEKDDLYGDGRWTGRNLAGRVGIFPKDYTTPARPVFDDVRTPTAGLNEVDGCHGTPPVDVEISDESDADDEHPHLHRNPNARPSSSPPRKTPSMRELPKDTHSVLPPSPSPLPTSDHSSPTHPPSTLEAPKADVPPSDASEPAQAEINLRSPSKSPASPTHSMEPSQRVNILNTQPTAPNTATPSIPPIPDSLSVPSISHTPALPSPTTPNAYHTVPILPQPSVTIPGSNSSRIYPFSPTSNLVSIAISGPSSAAGSALMPPLSTASTVQTQPCEWTVGQVVEWARNRGFDDSVCAKFQEHEITGDVLLELDVQMLKEIDIPVFGKRMRIASAIQELRRPASITSSDAVPVVPHRVVLSFPKPSAHSYNSSLSSAAPHSPSSPLSYAQMQQRHVFASGYNGGELANVPVMEPRSRADSEPETTTAGESVVPALGHGSQAIGPGATIRDRPVSLALSSSDCALHVPTHLTLTPESDVKSRSIKRLTSVTDNRAVPTPLSVSAAGPSSMGGAGGNTNIKPGAKVLDQLRQTLGEADFSGWMMKKRERHSTWKMRFFYLKGPHLYFLRSKTETKVKVCINIYGYKVVADDTINPGRYGFRIIHEVNKPHAFASDEHAVVRDWMKALMKATIDRDYTRPVISSSNIATIPRSIAQAVNPAPRPPSPTQRDAVKRAIRAPPSDVQNSHESPQIRPVAVDPKGLVNSPESSPPHISVTTAIPTANSDDLSLGQLPSWPMTCHIPAHDWWCECTMKQGLANQHPAPYGLPKASPDHGDQAGHFIDNFIDNFVNMPSSSLPMDGGQGYHLSRGEAQTSMMEGDIFSLDWLPSPPSDVQNSHESPQIGPVAVDPKELLMNSPESFPPHIPVTTVIPIPSPMSPRDSSLLVTPSLSPSFSLPFSLSSASEGESPLSLLDFRRSSLGPCVETDIEDLLEQGYPGNSPLALERREVLRRAMFNETAQLPTGAREIKRLANVRKTTEVTPDDVSGMKSASSVLHCTWAECTHSCNRPDRLKTHVFTHIGFKPFPCDRSCGDPHCTARFYSKGDCNSHQTRHEKKKICENCGEECTGKNWQRHARSTKCKNNGRRTVPYSI